MDLAEDDIWPEEKLQARREIFDAINSYQTHRTII
jgi:hypothetical protein